MMDFTPIEPIASFQSRKKIATTEFSQKGAGKAETVEDGEDFFGSGQKFLSSYSSSSTFSEPHTLGSKRLRKEEEEERERVKFGTELRSIGPGFVCSSTGITPDSASSGRRGRARGRGGRGGRGRGGMGARAGLGRGREVDSRDEEGEEERLRRLYRSLG